MRRHYYCLLMLRIWAVLNGNHRNPFDKSTSSSVFGIKFTMQILEDSYLQLNKSDYWRQFCIHG